MARPKQLRRRGKGQRGSALVLAILILFAMLALGMLAMRLTTQNIAGAGNMRMNKQARYVAEAGLHHALTLLTSKGQALMTLRASNSQLLEIDSNGRVAAIEVEENGDVQVGNTEDHASPDLLDGALGAFGGNSGLVPSYKVWVDGFVLSSALPGDDIKNRTCLVQVTAFGYVADEALPQPADIAGDERFAEHALKAAAKISGIDPSRCVRE